MLPKNSKHYIIPTATELDIDSELVEDAVTFYYGRLRKSLSNLESHNIQVECLGSFKAMKSKLPEFIAKYTKQLAVTKPRSLNQMRVYKETERSLRQMMGLQTMIAEDKKRKAEFFNKKDGNTSKNI
jgi:hypothetical protein